MKLTGEQFRQLHSALLDAFPSKGLFQLMIRTGLGENPSAIVRDSDLTETIYGLIQWAEARDGVKDLVEEACLANPENLALRDFAASQLGIRAPATDTTVLTTTPSGSSDFQGGMSGAIILRKPTASQIAEQFRKPGGLIVVRGLNSQGLRTHLVPIYREAMPEDALYIYTDLDTYTDEQMSNADAYFKALAEDVAARLSLDVNLGRYWKARLGPQRNMINFVHDHVLKSTQGLLLWRIHHVDRLLHTEFSDDAFSFFRVLYNEDLSNLMMMLCCYADPNTFVRDHRRSPFNVGVRLEFTA